MRSRSVVALIRPRNDHRQQFARPARQFALFDHQRLIEGKRGTHHTRAQALNADHVKNLSRALQRRIILAAQETIGLIFRNGMNPGHTCHLPFLQHCTPGDRTLAHPCKANAVY